MDKNESEYARQRLELCLQIIWNILDNSLFEKLGVSISRRIEACIVAKGWHTKY